MKFISAARNPQIRERLHYIADAVKSAINNPGSHNMFEVVKSPLYLVGKVYKNFEADTEVSGNFCLLHPNKFDEVYRGFWNLYFVKNDVPLENLKFIDM